MTDYVDTPASMGHDELARRIEEFREGDWAKIAVRMMALEKRASAAVHARGCAEAERDKLNARIGRLERLLERED